MASNRDDFGIAIRYALLQRGAKQKFSIFSLIVVAIIIFFIDVNASKPGQIARGLLNDFIYRISFVASSPISFVDYATKGIANHFNVYKENQNLKEELASLKAKDLNTEFVIQENKNLSKFVDEQLSASQELVFAKVILDKDSPFIKSLIINKGSKAGIEKGMPVIEKGNLVGRVVEVNFLSARVLLLDDLNSRIPVTLEPNSAQAILVGSGEDNQPQLSFLPERFEVEEEYKVFTSGKDGILSAGIPIGETYNEDGRLRVRLFSDPNQINYISVVLVKENPALRIN